MGLLGVSCPHRASLKRNLAVAQAEHSMCCMQQSVRAATATELQSTRTPNARGSSSNLRPGLWEDYAYNAFDTFSFMSFRCPETGELFKIEFSLNAWNRAGLANRLSMCRQFVLLIQMMLSNRGQSLERAMCGCVDGLYTRHANLSEF